MSGTNYVILAFVIGGGLLWGYAILLWAREYKASKGQGHNGGRS